MIRRKVLPVILVVVMAMTALLLTGCNETTLGTSNWTTNGGDPSLTKQEEVADDKLVEFGMYPQTKAAADVQSTIKSNVKIDPETGLWTEYNDEKASARYDLETGYFVYQAKVEGVAQAEQYYMMCGENLYLVEPIKWIVLGTSGSESILISSKILDGGRKYNNLYGECTWAESSLRDWLNGTDEYDINNGANYKAELNFLNRAFTEAEISALKKVSLRWSGWDRRRAECRRTSSSPRRRRSGRTAPCFLYRDCTVPLRRQSRQNALPYTFYGRR